MNILPDLLRFKTTTPNEDGSVSYLQEKLEKIGFQVITKQFTDAKQGSHDTWNLYAYTNKNAKKNLTFIGHMDVVPPGKEYLWTFPPFDFTIENDIVYGRGVVDMKTAIACFISAYEKSKITTDSCISLLITWDEEGNSINGTQKMLKFLASEGFQFSDAITGEPTCENTLGDVIKIGRRGSITFDIEVIGKQGHAAYPHLAKNPTHELAKIIIALKSHKFDDGNQNFDPTNLEFVGIETSTTVSNVIPNSASATFNIRFNDEHSSQSIESSVKSIISAATTFEYRLKSSISGESFLTEKSKIAEQLKSAIKIITNIDAKFSTSGGTSDARFMKDYANVVEFGLLNKTAHKIDENASINDIKNLEKIYAEFIRLFCL